jgi:hypothetical protein
MLCQGLALEKKHAIRPKIVEATEVLEEDEASAVEEAQPQLEEEEEEKSAEEPALEEKSGDEENDDDVAEDNKDSKDRILEEHTIAAHKVSSDVDRMLEALDSEDSHFSAETVKSAKNNLRAIRKNSEDLLTASGTRASNLKSAINLRMQALRMMLNQGGKDHELEASQESENELEEEEESPKVRSVVSDVEKMTKSLEESDMSDDLRREAKANLESIAEDAKKFAKATGSRASDLKKAIGYRVKALKIMLAEPKAKKVELEEDNEKASKVLDDVHHLQAALKTASLPAKIKKEAHKNLSKMLKDAEEMSNTTPARREKLTKAIKLRTQALRLQLEEH